MTKKQKRQEAACECCQNCSPIGDGDHICESELERAVLVDYEPTSDYLWCNGRLFQEL